MADPCKALEKARDDALDRLEDAANARDRAQETYDEETSILDTSTFVTGAATVAVLGACLSNPVGWVTCGIASLGGAATITASETGRSRDIDRASDALADAELKFWRSYRDFWQSQNTVLHCYLHNPPGANP